MIFQPISLFFKEHIHFTLQQILIDNFVMIILLIIIINSLAIIYYYFISIINWLYFI